MEVDKKLVEKAMLVLSKIDVELDFNSIGDFIENYAMISNKIFITLGRVHGWKQVNLQEEYNSATIGTIRYDLENNSYSLSERNGRLCSFTISGSIKDYDKKCITEDYFNTKSSLDTLKLTDLVKMKVLMVTAIANISSNFDQLNRSMAQIKGALDGIGGLK